MTAKDRWQIGNRSQHRPLVLLHYLRIPDRRSNRRLLGKHRTASPLPISQTMQMLKNDLLMTLERYLEIEEERVSLQIDYSPALLTIRVPLQNTEDTHA